MRKLLLPLACWLVAASSFASDGQLIWDTLPGTPAIDTWSVYLGTAPGSYGLVISGLAVPTYTFPDGAMAQNQRNYIVLTATNVSGESAFSTEVNGFPRAVVTSAVPTQQPGFIRLTIDGSNFSDGIVETDVQIAGMTVVAVTRVSALQLLVDYTIDPGTPDDPAELTIMNIWDDAAGFIVSLPSTIFLVPSLVPAPPIWVDIL